MGILFLRTVILYAVISFSMRLMGKRQAGELQPTELAVTVIISNVASLPLEQTSFPFLNGLIPVLTLVSLEVVMSYAALRWRRLRLLVSGQPIVVIFNGVICQEALRALRFSIDDLTEELREAGVFDPSEVQVAVVETSGRLSVHRRPENEPLSPQSLAELEVRVGNRSTEFTMEVTDANGKDLRPPETGALRPKSTPPPPCPAVLDGELQKKVLLLNRIPEQAVFHILEQENMKLNEVLLLTVDTDRRYTLVRKEAPTK